jgi:hypothetical protein
MKISRGEPKKLWEKLLQCHFVHHESHTKSTGIEPEAPRGEPMVQHLNYGTVCTRIKWINKPASYTQPQTDKQYKHTDTNTAGVGKAQSVSRRAMGWKVGVRFPVKETFFSLHSVQTSSGAHPASYLMGTGDSLPGGKAAGAWSWPLTSISVFTFFHKYVI